MKVVRFPTPAERTAREDQSAAIDAALNGESAGVEADALRELRADVRTLAAPLDPEFERELQARVAEWGAQRLAPRPSVNERMARLRTGITASTSRSLAAGGAVIALVALVVTLVVVGSQGEPLTESSSESGSASGRLAAPAEKRSAKSGEALVTAEETLRSGAAAGEAAGVSGATSAPGRLQQLGASVSLATTPTGVQQAAEGVTRLGIGDGGYVQSSHVQVRSGGPSEATLTLSIPSAKLSSAIAALGRIASERAVNQESQDITGSYDSARRQLSDAEAVRRALLKALAAATTQGQIDSLREQLNGNRATISRDRAALQAVSRRAANSQLEVTITGSGSAAAQRSTLGQGLDDAGHVLAVAAAVALIALAVLGPLAVVALALDALLRAWRRRRREGALDS
jgi:uncharacterized protein DUF4349